MKNKINFSDEEWESIKNNGAYCPALFNSLYLSPQSHITNCCVMQEHDMDLALIVTPEQKNIPVVDLLNQEWFRDVRKDALNGIKNKACNHCWRSQKHTPEKEYRQNFIKYTDDKNLDEQIRNGIYEDYSVDFEIVKMEHMDVRFSTLCNLTCRSCSSAFSSSWYKEDLAYDKITRPTEINTKWKSGLAFKPGGASLTVDSIRPHLDTVQRLYFAGGEPVMLSEHYEILQHLIDIGRTDVKLSYNTNFSKLIAGNKDIIPFWKQFENITIGASLDGSHEKGEYIRKGIVWSEVEKNIQRLKKECPHIYFYVSPTVSIMNAYNITEFHKEWFEKRYIRVNDFRLNVLYGPETYCVSNLPRSHKNRLIKIYKEHIQWIRDHTVGSLPMLEPTEKDALVISDYEALIDFIDNTEPSHEWQDSWFKHFWTDKNRKENFFEVFPEYEDLKPILLSDLKDRWFDIPEQVLIEVKNIYED
jgi:organic radical activating enzyme